LHCKPSWPPQAAYLSGTFGSFIAHDSNTLDPSADEFVALLKYEYDSMHLVSTSDITILAHLSISYLASSSPSS